MGAIKVAMVGGVPPLLGGGGLERQIEHTANALNARGHDARPVTGFDGNESVDLVHAFGCGADVWQQLQHWRRNRVPLIGSPVIVCSPGRAERSLLLGARLGSMIPNVSSMVRDVTRAPDHVIAITDYERSVVRKLAGPSKPVTVIANGVDVAQPADTNPVDSEPPYVAMLGTVTERKGQAAALEALGSSVRFVVVGGFEGTAAERSEWKQLVARSGAVWTDEVADRTTVARILRDAKALLLFSSAEVQSLAVLEALAQGTPVVASDLPSHRELAEKFPGWLVPVRRLSDAGVALEQLIAAAPTGPTPQLESWANIGAQIESVYAEVLASTSS